MVKMRLFVLSTALAFGITGCSYKIAEKGGINAHKVVQMEQSKFMPSKEQLESNKTKVVVFPLDNKAPKAKNAGAGEAASGAIEKYILESGNVEIVDREAAQKLQNEIALIEMDGSKELKGPQLADYAITGEISSVSNSSFFWPQGKPGKMMGAMVAEQLLGRKIQMPPEYEYTVKVKGKIKVFGLPDARLIKTFDLDDDKSLSKSAGIAIGGITIAMTPPPLSTNEEAGLTSGATTDAVESIRHDIKNFFTKKGYVLEKRISADGKDFIFLVTFGSADGAKEGDELEIYTIEESAARATGKTSVEESVVGKAKIADIVKSGECWIHMNDKVLADKIKMGDYVKIKFSKGMGDYAKSVGKFMF